MEKFELKIQLCDEFPTIFVTNFFLLPSQNFFLWRLRRRKRVFRPKKKFVTVRHRSSLFVGRISWKPLCMHVCERACVYVCACMCAYLCV